jgi:hypothetical protein
MKPEQTRRRNQIQSLVDDNRPVATWLTERMTETEATAFDEVETERNRQGLVGQLLERVGREMDTRTKRPKVTK